MKLESILERAKYEGKTIIGTSPRLFFPIAHVRRRNLPDSHWLRPELTKAETDLVIEGFPRSGNTFAVVAFQLSQPRKLRVAHHLHAPAQVLRAIELHVPALVLLREPTAAVASFHLRRPELTLATALRAYVRCYRSLVPYAQNFVIATFEEVTSDFGRVIENVNERTGTAFTPFEHTESNVRACFAVIEERNRDLSGGTVAANAIARPVKAREGDTARLLERLARPDLEAPLAAARSVYHQLLDTRGDSP